MRFENETLSDLCELSEGEQRSILGGGGPNTTPSSTVLTNAQLQTLFDFGQVGGVNSAYGQNVMHFLQEMNSTSAGANLLVSLYNAEASYFKSHPNAAPDSFSIVLIDAPPPNSNQGALYQAIPNTITSDFFAKSINSPNLDAIGLGYLSHELYHAFEAIVQGSFGEVSTYNGVKTDKNYAYLEVDAYLFEAFVLKEYDPSNYYYNVNFAGSNNDILVNAPYNTTPYTGAVFAADWNAIMNGTFSQSSYQVLINNFLYSGFNDQGTYNFKDPNQVMVTSTVPTLTSQDIYKLFVNSYKSTGTNFALNSQLMLISGSTTPPPPKPVPAGTLILPSAPENIDPGPQGSTTGSGYGNPVGGVAPPSTYQPFTPTNPTYTAPPDSTQSSGSTTTSNDDNTGASTNGGGIVVWKYENPNNPSDPQNGTLTQTAPGVQLPNTNYVLYTQQPQPLGESGSPVVSAYNEAYQTAISNGYTPAQATVAANAAAIFYQNNQNANVSQGVLDQIAQAWGKQAVIDSQNTTNNDPTNNNPSDNIDDQEEDDDDDNYDYYGGSSSGSGSSGSGGSGSSDDDGSLTDGGYDDGGDEGDDYYFE